MKFLPHSFGGVAIAAALLASSAVSAQTLGGGGGPDAGQVEKCDAPKGTLAVVEPQYAVLQSLSRYGLQSPAAVIRLIIQQSNCFQIVERGAAMQNMAQERALASSGQLQGGQNVGQGGRAAAVGALAGGVKFKEAQTAMTIADTRSGIQVAAAQGSASQTDINLGAAVFGRYGGGGLGGYTSTAEGKIIAASFLDNWNNIVRTIRNNPSLIQAKAGPASQANAAASVKAGSSAGNAGDVYVAKIAGVKVYRSPSEGPELTSLTKFDEVIFEGDEQNGFMKVATPRGSGWVKAIMMRRQ